MDRDKRWERIKKAYDLLIHGKGTEYTEAIKAVEDSYNSGITDEFILPIVITGNDGKPIGIIDEGDAVICFNFRTDRCREITEVLTQKDFPEYEMHKINLHYITMTVYDETFVNVKNLFKNDDLKMTLGEVLERENLQQVRIAEALLLYGRGLVSFARAADLAGISREEMIRQARAVGAGPRFSDRALDEELA